MEFELVTNKGNSNQKDCWLYKSNKEIKNIPNQYYSLEEILQDHKEFRKLKEGYSFSDKVFHVWISDSQVHTERLVFAAVDIIDKFGNSVEVIPINKIEIDGIYNKDLLYDGKEEVKTIMPHEYYLSRISTLNNKI